MIEKISLIIVSIIWSFLWYAYHTGEDKDLEVHKIISAIILVGAVLLWIGTIGALMR